MMKRNSSLGVAAVMSVLSVLSADRLAQACGGFFCSQLAVDQTAERILFALSPNKTTAYIQIYYQGDASMFSWVVPVQAVPKITLGSQTTFSILDGLTRPQFRWDTSSLNGGGCYPQYASGNGTQDAAASSDGGRGVDVIDAKQVGPFDTVTLKSRSTAELTKWLADNDYTQPPSAAPLIDHYVQLGMYFVAVKLTKSASVGEIAPLVLEMETSEACVPLVLTQIAAVPDMPVLVYVLGEARAFPRNWFHVTLDLAQIDWLRSGSNYTQLATAAINEAAGHGFVTEFAGKSSIAANRLYSPNSYNTSALANETDPVKVVNALAFSGFPRDATLLSILRQFIPEPASLVERGIDERSFYNNIGAYSAELAGFKVDSAGLVTALDERVVKPLRDAQELFNTHPYLTRLMSTVSPNEMNRDPLFLMNPDLADVSNIHTAKVAGSCDQSGAINNMKLTLEDGRVLTLGDTQLYSGVQEWPYAKMLPHARSIELVGAAGQPVRIKRTEIVRVDGELNTESPEVVRGRVVADGAMEPVPPLTNPPAVNAGTKDSGCSYGGGGFAIGWLGVLAALGWVFVRSRRR